MDAARSALRLGARSVRVAYRRTRREMPAIAEEIDEALEEGVVLDFLTQPIALQPVGQADGDAAGSGLLCRRMVLGPPDESGRRRPLEVPGSEFEVPCTRVILALGQGPDLSVFPEGTQLREGGGVLGVVETPVYAVGDVATNDGTVAAAIGSGRRVALQVHRILTGEVTPHGEETRRRTDVDVWTGEVITSDGLRLHLFDRARPEAGAAIPMARRLVTFDEIHVGIEDPREARRCLSCGVCNECDVCVTYCPEGVLTRVGHRLVFDYAYCKGCGICVTECPRNVVFMSAL